MFVNEIVILFPDGLFWFWMTAPQPGSFAGGGPPSSTQLRRVPARSVSHDHCQSHRAATLIIALVARGRRQGDRPEQMQFLPEEVRALFAHNYATGLHDGGGKGLADQSEGWITGLLLTAYTRWQGVLQALDEGA